MKATIVLLAEMLTFVLACFFMVLAIVTPWGVGTGWKITCIVLCAVMGSGFIATFILSRTKFKLQLDDNTEEEAKEENPTEEKVEE